MDETFGAGLLSLLLQQLQAYRVSIGGQLAASFLGFFRMFVLLYVVFVGYRVMMGMMGARTKDATISIALVVLLHGLIAETSAFQAWIEEPIIGSTLGLAQMFADAGSGGSHLFSRLDAAVSSIIGTVEKIEPGGNILTNSMIYIKVSLASLILLLAVCGLYLVYLAQVSLALVSMYLLMMIAAPFIFFAAFSETRFIAWTWFKAVLNYAVWSVLLSLIMAVGVAGIEESARQ
ncbi:MAG: type IV secretion system protein, partial [Nitrosospira sp.]